MTNGGGVPNAEKTQILAKLLNLPKLTGPVIMAHDPIPDLLRQHDIFEEKILVISKSERLSRQVAHEWALPNAVVLEDFHASTPWVWPLEDDGRKIEFSHIKRVAAICIVATPRDWGQTLQLCVDLLRFGGNLFSENSSSSSSTSPLLFVSNPDFDYRARPPGNRMTTGAWLVALEALLLKYKVDLKKVLKVTGKPHLPIYELANKYFNVSATGKEVETVYCIGDNPKSDISGAENFAHYKSILVLTGVAKEDDKSIPANFVRNDITDAVDLILSETGINKSKL